MKRILLITYCVLTVMILFAQVHTGKVFHFAFNLRTQYRYVDVCFTESGDTLTMHWSRKTDEGLRSGAFAMPKQSRELATQLCYLMPEKDKTIITPHNELFVMLSRDALNQLKQSGKCRYNNTTLTLLDVTDRLLHVKDYDEGYEMWIEDNLDFPLIHKMINNPVEIDWEITQ